MQALGKLAALRARRGERALALVALRDAVIGAITGQVAITAVFLNYGVSVAADLDAWELAATLSAVGTSSMLSATERTDRQAALDRARIRLGRDAYDTAVATGTAMSHDELAKYTLGELDRLLGENKVVAGKGQARQLPDRPDSILSPEKRDQPRPLKARVPKTHMRMTETTWWGSLYPPERER